MNKLFASALIAAAAFAAAPSFAGQYLGGEDGAFAPDAPVVSTLTRAQVHAEAVQAAHAGTAVATGEGVDLGASTVAQVSDVTRAQVRAETVAAVRQGLRIGGEG